MKLEPGGPNREYDWARDAGELFTFLGIYLAGFQAIDGVLDQILLLERSHERWAETQATLVGMSNHQKVEAAIQAALNEDRFPNRGRPNWADLVAEIRRRLHNERDRRNAIMHSQYLMEGVESGLSAIRSDRRRAEGVVRFDQEELDRARMDQILGELAQLSFDVSQVHSQLVHWTVSRSVPSATPQ